MKKKYIALVAGIVASGVSGGLIFGQILNVGLLSVGSVLFAGLTTAAVFTGFGLLAVSAVLLCIGCYQLWKNWVKKPDALPDAPNKPVSNKPILKELPSNSSKKYELYRLSPDVLKHNVTKYLDETDVGALASTNKKMLRFFNPVRMLATLLRAVVTGNQDKVIQILRRDPALAVTKGSVTDKSGRTFPMVSAAELVRWCGDLRYMGNAMLDILKSLPDQLLAQKIKAAWVALDDAYDLNAGLVYRLPGSTESAKSIAFSLVPLCNALQDYIDTFDTMTWAQREAQWCTKVGAQQFLLTAIYLQHYCNPDILLYPTPSFEGATFRRSLMIYHDISGKAMSVWGDVDNGLILGRDFGLVSWEGRGAWSPHAWARFGDVEAAAATRDLDALRACEERTALDLIAFKTKL